MKFAYSLLIALVLVSCSNDDGNSEPSCTLEFVLGLNVTVRDVVTTNPITQDVVVTATDGNYSEVLELIAGTEIFGGAGERAWNYTLTVTAPGFETFVSDPVRVTANECHVITEQVDISLIRN